MVSGRSPAYPYIDLGKAVEIIKKIHSFTRGHAVNTESLFRNLGFNGLTGSAKKTLAALKYFGLLEQQHGSKEAKLSTRALHIIHGVEDSDEQRQAIKDAFLDPVIYAYCWDTWGDDDIADEFMKSHLILKKGFNDSTVMSFISGYKQSRLFAGITKSGNMSDGNDDIILPKTDNFIQWESQGVSQFPKPCKVVSVSDDGNYVFVAESDTGIPVAEVEVVEYDDPDDGKDKTPPANPQHTGLIKPPPIGVNMRQDTFTLQGQGEILIQFPSAITKEDFEDFTDYIDILKRKIGRSVIKESEQIKSDEKDQ